MRLLFFLLVAAVALVGGNAVALVIAALGVCLGALSISLARRHGCRLAHTVATADWLLLGVCLAATGGVRSWMVVIIPLLVLAHLMPSQRSAWPYLLAPVLLTAIVVAIADPTLGGNRAFGLLELAALAACGVGLAARLAPGAPRRALVASIDPTTGLYTRTRLATLIGESLEDAAADHAPMSIGSVSGSTTSRTRATSTDVRAVRPLSPASRGASRAPWDLTTSPFGRAPIPSS